MNGKKKYIWILTSLLIIYLAIYFIPWRHKIDTTIQGMQFRIGDKDYSKDVSIKVKGVYKQYLIKKDTFEGAISVDIYDFTHNTTIAPTTFYDGHGNLIYESKNYLELHSLGLLVCSPDFHKMLITVNEPVEKGAKGWSGENGLVIAAPANNREEAIEAAEILSSKSKWLSRTKWE